MNSANGKIPAGSVSIPLTAELLQISQQMSSPIEKCPDKTAAISYEISAEVVRTLG